MMMRLRRASLLVAFSLLTSAATAYAECAWVLWYRVTEYRDGEATEAPFDAAEAHPTLAACQGVLQERLTEWALVEATTPDSRLRHVQPSSLSKTRTLSRRRESTPTAASPTPWTRADRRRSERHRRPPLPPVAPHQPRPARDAAHALERRGGVAGSRRVDEGARAEEQQVTRGPRAGWMGAGSASAPSPSLDAFRRGLR